MNVTSMNQTDCPEVKVPVPLFFTIGVVSLAENVLVVVAVIWNRNLHSPMYAFICSLAAFNTIASLTKTWETLMIVLADVGQLEKKGPSETRLDDVVDSLMCMSFVGSFFSFLAIAVDRYVWTVHRAHGVTFSISIYCIIKPFICMRDGVESLMKSLYFTTIPWSSKVPLSKAS